MVHDITLYSLDVTQKPAEEGEGVNTTLQAYFFGSKGENKLQYQGFRR